MSPRREPTHHRHRPGQRPAEAWSFIPPYRDKPLPERFAQGEGTTPIIAGEAAFRLHNSSRGTGPTAPERPGHTILARGNWQTLRDWSLVLSSQQIPHHFEQTEEGPWSLEVIDARAAEANHQIALYRAENPEKPMHAPLPPLRWSAQPLWVLLIPVLGYYWQSAGGALARNLGIADAEKIIEGQWWRAFTALTLHADTGHLLSNLVSGFLVLALVAARLPLGRIVPQLVFASGLANLGVAFLVGSDFRSLGFSTFVFTALGALGTLEWRLKPIEEAGLMRRFAPWFGVFALAVFMGLGANSDILAHFIGLGVGLLVGFLPGRRQLQWGVPPGLGEAIAVFGTWGFFILVWLRALGKLALL